jgi:hypothetical protein
MNVNLLFVAKLCAVLDAKYATIEEIAVESDYSVETIESLANGLPVRIDLQTRHRVGKALAPHFRAHPELYRELTIRHAPTARKLGERTRLAAPSPHDLPQRKPRGVFEIEGECDCWRIFLIRDSQGRNRRVVKIPSGEFREDEDLDKLWAWLERRDPLLKVI